MDFKCMKDSGHKFSLEPPEDKKGVAWIWKGIVKCPYCGSEDLEEVMSVSPFMPDKSKDLNKLRSENSEMTRQAKIQAAQAQREEAARNPDVAVSPVKGYGRFGGDTVRVKKNIMESIESKKPDNYG